MAAGPGQDLESSCHPQKSRVLRAHVLFHSACQLRRRRHRPCRAAGAASGYDARPAGGARTAAEGCRRPVGPPGRLPRPLGARAFLGELVHGLPPGAAGPRAPAARPAGTRSAGGEPGRQARAAARPAAAPGHAAAARNRRPRHAGLAGGRPAAVLPHRPRGRLVSRIAGSRDWDTAALREWLRQWLESTGPQRSPGTPAS